MFDRLMIKLGHKYAFVDVAGEVAVYRYYVFFAEKHIATTWKEKYLPNLLIHHFVGKSPEQTSSTIPSVAREVAHTHPWSTLSFILKGGYSEEINYKDIKVNKRFSLRYRSWDTSHRMLLTQPDTWTLFFHGIRRGVWAFDLRVHEKVCDWCQANNDNVCFNEGKNRIHEFSAKRDLRDSSKASIGWRETSWIKYDENFDKMIETRKASLKRGKIVQPEVKWDAVLREEFNKDPLQK
jgi:hypothetical protein